LVRFDPRRRSSPTRRSLPAEASSATWSSGRSDRRGLSGREWPWNKRTARLRAQAPDDRAVRQAPSAADAVAGCSTATLAHEAASPGRDVRDHVADDASAEGIGVLETSSSAIESHQCVSAPSPTRCTDVPSGVTRSRTACAGSARRCQLLYLFATQDRIGRAGRRAVVAVEDRPSGKRWQERARSSAVG